MRNSKGYTLVELIVVMGIFVGVIVMTTSAFESILKSTSQQTKSAESQIEGIVGLEMLRYDIEHAGYGLPWAYPSTLATFTEVDSSPAAGMDSTAFNEGNPPRALISGNFGTDATNPGSSYLVIKSVVTPLSKVAKRWSYVNYTAAGPTNASYIKKWQTGAGYADNDVQPHDRVITLSASFSSSGSRVNKTLVMNGAAFSYEIGDDTTVIDPAFMPPDSTQMYTVYALGRNNPVMPYNRTDYYVKKPSANMPKACNGGTGVLYKATVVNDTARSASFVENPLLDCVGDLQVAYQLDMDGDGVAGTYARQIDDTHVDVDGSESATQASVLATLGDAALLRAQLKQVLVYILTHEGGKDRGFTYPGDEIVVADRTYRREGRVWSADAMRDAFGADWRNYRWKVYALAIRPKNLN